MGIFPQFKRHFHDQSYFSFMVIHFQLFLFMFNILGTRNSPMGTPRRIDVDWILCRYAEDQISTYFHVVSTYVFDVILMAEISTLFPRTFFVVISLVEKSALFPRTFFDKILLYEKSILFPRTFFDVISMVEKSTLFLSKYFFDVISLVKNSSLSPHTFLFRR